MAAQNWYASVEIPSIVYSLADRLTSVNLQTRFVEPENYMIISSIVAYYHLVYLTVTNFTQPL